MVGSCLITAVAQMDREAEEWRGGPGGGEGRGGERRGDGRGGEGREGNGRGGRQMVKWKEAGKGKKRGREAWGVCGDGEGEGADRRLKSEGERRNEKGREGEGRGRDRACYSPLG